MKTIWRKLISLMTVFAVTLAALPAAASGSRYTARDAYMYFAREYPEFILNVLERGYDDGVGESLLLRFLIDMQRSFYYENRITPVTEANFERVFIDKVKENANASEYATLQSAIYDAYPEASDALRKNRIHPSISPLVDTVREMVLERNMLSKPEPMENYEFRMEGFEEPPVISVDQLGDLPPLPSSVKVLSESGLYIKMPVRWNELPDTAYAGGAKVLGRVTPPEGAITGTFDGRAFQRVEIKPLSGGGKCGTGLTWTLENGVLTVSGKGRMDSYSNADRTPWASVRDAVNKIVIGEGVTYVGIYAFAGIKNLASPSVTIPSTVSSLGRNAFAGTALDTVRFEGEVNIVNGGAFDAGATLYGGRAGCAADRYAAANGLTFVPDGWTEPEIVGLEASLSGDALAVNVETMNTDGLELRLAVYGGGMELLDTAPVTGGTAELTEVGAKYLKVFCWDGMTPLCETRFLRLTA